MAFKYDGATFTPGTLTPNSGSRDVVIELTLASAAITSGAAYTGVIVTNSATINGSTDFYAYDSGDGISSVSGAADWAENNYILYVMTSADSGHLTFTITIANSGADAANRYVSIMLPSGSFATSAAISIPGIGA